MDESPPNILVSNKSHIASLISLKTLSLLNLRFPLSNWIWIVSTLPSVLESPSSLYGISLRLKVATSTSSFKVSPAFLSTSAILNDCTPSDGLFDAIFFESTISPMYISI